MNIKHFVFSLQLLLLLWGCNYSPDGEHFVELDQTGNLPAVEVELNFDSDTLYVSNNEWIYFSYKQNGDKVNWARFIIDGEETSPNDEQHGGIELRWYFPGFLPGTHTLSMQLFTQSGTGSIADKVGAEGYLLQKDWVLIITDDWGIASGIVDTSFENGLLKVEWEKYKGLNFEYYQVYKYVQPTGLPDQLVATVTNQHQTAVVDPDYHGENSRYFVRVNNRYRGKSIDMEGPLPQVNASNNEQGDIVLNWKKPPFWNALKGYRILDDDISWTDSGFVPLHLIDDPQTESFVITDPYFGYIYDLWLQLDPKGNAYVENWTRPVHLATRVEAVYGPESPGFGWGTSGTGKTIYLLTQDGLTYFDTESLEAAVQNNFPKMNRFIVSNHDNYLVSHLKDNYQVYLADLKHPANNKTINFSDRLQDIGHLVSVSDQATGVVLSGQKAVLMDFISEKILAEKELEYNGLYRNHMSGDGKYFMLDTYGGYSWFSYSNGTITEMENIRENESKTVFSDFLPGEQTMLVTASNDHISLYNCETQELMQRWELTADWMDLDVFHVVKGTGELFLREKENLILLNLTTGSRTVIGKTRPSFFMNKWSLVYNNGQILWSEGRRLDVNDKL